MSKVCEICGKKPLVGNRIIRKGLAKYQGGIGLHTTAITPRRFVPNLHSVRCVVNGTVMPGAGRSELHADGQPQLQYRHRRLLLRFV